MAQESDDLETSLLHGEADEKHEHERPFKQRQPIRRYVSENRVTSCNIGLLATNIGLLCILVVNLMGRVYLPETASDLLYSPARAAVVPQKKLIEIELDSKNEYNGRPNPSNDAAWMRLFRYANIRLTPEELKPTNRESILLADGSGDFYGTLDVYHQLHCVKYLREYVHPEYYNVKITPVDIMDHVDHCLDMLRQVIMCRGDISLTTYSWIPNYKLPWPDFALEHECRNWESIDNWSKQRSIDVNDYSLIVHPDLGPSFLEPEWNRTVDQHDHHP